MSTAAWRRFLLALCALALILTGISIWTGTTAFAVPGITYAAKAPIAIPGSPTGTPFVQRVTVLPASPAYRSGLRTGDLVDLRLVSAADRFRWFTGSWWRSEPIQVPVVRDNSTHRVTIIAEVAPFTWDVWIGYAGTLWMLLFAALIAWRRAESAEARTLALLLIILNFGFVLFTWITPWPGIDAAVTGLSAILLYAGFALLVTYAMLFGRPPSLPRRVLAWLSYVSAGVAALYGIAFVVGIWTLTADPNQVWYSGSLGQIVAGVLPFLFPVLCVLVTVAQTRGAERARIAWASASLALLYVTAIATSVLNIFDPGVNFRFLAYVDNTANFLAPIGLTYSLLNRRLLDIGFAINRAAVFSGVSIILVGTFVLVEWLLTEWFRHASHTTNVLISAALVIALGLSVRAVHSRVDRILDTVFFRKRHEDETAIRTFAHEAAYITNPATLLQRAVETLQRHADAAFVTVALDDGAGEYGGVNENDPAIVALRAGRKILDLHTLRTELRGEFAYAMSARGRLVGALVIGPKRSGDSYAPDESDAIAQLAHGAGDALDVLSAKKGDARDAILEAIRNSIRALPDAIIDRLRASDGESQRRPNF